MNLCNLRCGIQIKTQIRMITQIAQTETGKIVGL